MIDPGIRVIYGKCSAVIKRHAYQLKTFISPPLVVKIQRDLGRNDTIAILRAQRAGSNAVVYPEAFYDPVML
jgi:hypothetical protein